MASAALVVVYNHQYNDNIQRVNDLYKSRFSAIYHLVPFYEGNEPNVIPVYESSHYFQGYIAQGFRSFYKPEFDHYFFIGDDVLLNPAITESNYKEILQLDNHTSFMPQLIELHTMPYFWLRVREAYMYSPQRNGIEVDKLMPGKEACQAIFQRQGLSIKPLKFEQIFHQNFPAEFSLENVKNKWMYRLRKWKNAGKDFHLPYPLVGSYSDIFVVSGSIIQKFCHYSGVFAATRLHVEVAAPSALVMCDEKIVTEDQLRRKGRALWGSEDMKMLDPFDFNLTALLDKFPQDHLYLHPIKLSKWKKK